MSDKLAFDYSKTVAQGLTELCELEGWESMDGDQWAEDGSPLTLGTWLDDALDIEITRGGSGDYRGARIAVTLGGPNAWLNTRSQLVEVYWGGESACYVAPAELCDILDDFLGVEG